MPFWKGKSSPSEAGCFPNAGAFGSAHDKSVISFDHINGVTSQVSKPFHLMTIEELLDALPGCSPAAINELWIPTIRAKIAAAKEVLQGLEDRNLESQAGMTDLNEILKSVGRQAGLIAKTYHAAMSSAESILERDESLSNNTIIDLRQRLTNTEAECARLRMEVTTAKHTTESLMRTVRPAVVFSLTIPEQWSPAESQIIRQVLRDYPDADAETLPVTPTVRVPHSLYFEAMGELQRNTETVTTLHGVADRLSDITYEQSHKIDGCLLRLHSAIKVIKARDHEILLLDQRNKQLVEELGEHELAARVIDHERAGSAQLISGMKRMAHESDLKIQDKDHALFKMRKEVDGLREQLTMSQNKVRDLQEDCRPGYVAAQRQAGRVAASASSFALGVQSLQRGCDRPHQTYRIVAPSPNLAGPHQADLVSVPSSNIGRPVHSRQLSDPFKLSPALQTPPETRNKPRVLIKRPRENDKPLPSPPAVSPCVPRTAALDRPGAGSSSPTVVPYSTPTGARDTLCTPSQEKRVLSNITEASNETTTLSATSSDKEAFRSSINALDLLNNQTSPILPMSPAQEMAMFDEHRALKKVASEELSVPQLYHHSRKHL